MEEDENKGLMWFTAIASLMSSGDSGKSSSPGVDVNLVLYEKAKAEEQKRKTTNIIIYSSIAVIIVVLIIVLKSVSK